MAISPAEFAYVQKLVAELSAIRIDLGQEYLVESRLGPVAEQCGLPSISELIARLKDSPADGWQQLVVEAIATKETLFFRDAAVFEALQKEVLPDLVRKRANERRLAIWSAGCSTGQEPYSLAILLRQHFPQLQSWNTELLASDISRQALLRAGEGRFTQMEVSRGMPPDLLRAHFQPVEADWLLKDDIRRAVRFQHLNLAQRWPSMPRFDLILLRNVLIYFTVPMKRDILLKVRQALRPDGYLFLGTAETTLNLDDAFEQVQRGKAVYYRLRV